MDELSITEKPGSKAYNDKLAKIQRKQDSILNPTKVSGGIRGVTRQITRMIDMHSALGEVNTDEDAAEWTPKPGNKLLA